MFAKHVSRVRLIGRRACFALIASVAFGASAAPAHAQALQNLTATPIATPRFADAIPLYPGRAPGSERARQVERWELLPGERIVRNVTRPELIPILPDPRIATGEAVIIAPGGAYILLAIDKEGFQLARRLADEGIAAFVLKYRLNETPEASEDFLDVIRSLGPPPRDAGDSSERPRGISQPLAVDDAEAAVRLVRARASEWGVNPQRIGFVGFSAGAISGRQLIERHSPDAMPNFLGLIYGSMGPMPVPGDAPPLFVAIASDDPLFAGSGFGLIDAWRAANRPVELHFYERGGHGFGMLRQGLTSDDWVDSFLHWIRVERP